MTQKKDSRTDVRCNGCLSAMERREDEKRFVCRNVEECGGVEPFRDDATGKRIVGGVSRVIHPTETSPTPTPAQKEKRSTRAPRAAKRSGKKATTKKRKRPASKKRNK